jgi:hypothetical protein
MIQVTEKKQKKIEGANFPKLYKNKITGGVYLIFSKSISKFEGICLVSNSDLYNVGEYRKDYCFDDDEIFHGEITIKNV